MVKYSLLNSLLTIYYEMEKENGSHKSEEG